MRGTISPPGPTIEPSEPEKEMRLIESIIDAVSNPDVPKIISINSAHDYLNSAGFTVDENGFIIDKNTEDYVEPYAFSKKEFKRTTEVSDNIFNDYFVPLSETPVVNNTDKIHLTDLHTIHSFNDEFHPVKDDLFNLSTMVRYTGITFSVVTGWSDSIHFVDDSDVPAIRWEKESDVDMKLNCFGAHCDYVGSVTEWERDDKDRLVCPVCETLWGTRGVYYCSECDDRYQSENVSISSYSGSVSCKGCNMELNVESYYTRYSDLD